MMQRNDHPAQQHHTLGVEEFGYSGLDRIPIPESITSIRHLRLSDAAA